MSIGDGRDIEVRLSVGAWYASLAPHLQHAIAEHGRLRTYATGEVVFMQGDPVVGLFAVLSGQVSVAGLTSDGMEVLVATLRPGEWTGFLAVLDGGPYAFTTTATEPAEILCLPLAQVKRVFSDLEGLRALMQPELAASRRVYRYLVDLAMMTPKQRLARRLLDLAQTAYDGDVRSDGIDHVSQRQIAVSIMCSRQLTNSLLGDLEQAGVIKLSREHIQIRNRARLSAIAGDAGRV